MVARQGWHSSRLVFGFLVFTIGLSPGTAAGSASRSLGVSLATYATSQATHLYEAQGGRVVAYPLNKDGLPARDPDWNLTGGLRGAVWIGFDGAGYLYVSDSVLNQVRIYAPGSSGDATPVQLLQLPNGGPKDSGGCAMAVNKAGYIFETVLVDGFSCSTTILVYAPVTPQPGTWLSQPIHTISVPATPYVEGLAVDAAGRLYVTPEAKIYLYNDPVNEWQSPNQTIVARGIEHTTFAPSAIEAQSGDLYFQTQLRCCRPWQNVAVHAARSLTGVAPDRESESLTCNTSEEFGLEYSMAVNTNYLMFTCEDPNALLVYRNRPGHQRLVESLPSGYGLLLWP
jgi:hypothetical protein